ncbi:MAG: hypothetical protein ABI867_14910 [Kofleriaceae bacterium]
MGFRCRWLATRGRERDDVLARLRFKVVGELIEEVYDAGLYALEVDDWLVVIGDGFDHLDRVRRAEAASLSEGGDVIYLTTDDAARTFELAVFHEREPLWSITYDGRDGVAAPTFAGAVPWGARVLLGRLEKAQAESGGPKAEVDHIYELAPAYAMTLVGFRHDESLGGGEHVPIWQLAPKTRR